MDVPRSKVGNLTFRILRLLVTVGIVVAGYLIVVKPILKTTTDTIEGANESLNLEDIGRTLGNLDRQVQIEVRHAFHAAKKEGNPKKLVRCVERADGNARRIRRCTVKF